MPDSKAENRIKQLRIEQHKTQKDVASYIEMTEQAIANYETGKREPKLATWKKLADFFDVSVEYLQGTSQYRNLNALRDAFLTSQTDLINSPHDDSEINRETRNKIWNELNNAENAKAKEQAFQQISSIIENSPFSWDFIKVAMKTISNDKLTSETKSELSAILETIDVALNSNDLTQENIDNVGSRVKSMVKTVLTPKISTRERLEHLNTLLNSSPDKPTDND